MKHARSEIFTAMYDVNVPDDTVSHPKRFKFIRKANFFLLMYFSICTLCYSHTHPY